MLDQIDWSVVPDEFVIFDLETTGLDAYYSEILEIGAIRFNKQDYLKTGQVDTFQVFVKQNKPIPQEITKINSITDEMIKDGDCIYDALSGFFDFVGKRKMVAFNAKFDMKFIRSAASKCEYKLPRPFKVECALELARERLSNLPNYKLITLAESFHVDSSGAHRALKDCLMTMHVYINLLHAKNGLTYSGKKSILQESSISSGIIEHLNTNRNHLSVRQEQSVFEIFSSFANKHPVIVLIAMFFLLYFVSKFL